MRKKMKLSSNKPLSSINNLPPSINYRKLSSNTLTAKPPSRPSSVSIIVLNATSRPIRHNEKNKSRNHANPLGASLKRINPNKHTASSTSIPKVFLRKNVSFF
jgi:hypothetical protein